MRISQRVFRIRVRPELLLCAESGQSHFQGLPCKIGPSLPISCHTLRDMPITQTSRTLRLNMVMYPSFWHIVTFVILMKFPTVSAFRKRKLKSQREWQDLTRREHADELQHTSWDSGLAGLYPTADRPRNPRPISVKRTETKCTLKIISWILGGGISVGRVDPTRPKNKVRPASGISKSTGRTGRVIGIAGQSGQVRLGQKIWDCSGQVNKIRVASNTNLTKGGCR